jgi:putative SOS response-associated peptidase YedK
MCPVRISGYYTNISYNADMCGRYTLGNPGKIKGRFKTSNKVPLFDPSYNIAPSQTVPVITRNSPNRVTMMRWGFAWSKDAKHGTINIRKETTKEKKYFQGILLTQRCIIPSDGFYEWKTVNLEGKDEKYPFYIYLKDRSLFGFAGLYNKLSDAEGKDHYTFAILTCPPNSTVKKVHHRMPAILEESDEDAWLDYENKDFESLNDMIKPFPAKEMKLHPVTKRVNSPRNDDKRLIKPYEKIKSF